MHVKEQVKEFVHDVKRRFSHKHQRDTCSSFDSYDYSNADTLDDSSCSSASSLPGTPERSRLMKFVRPRTPSTPSKKHLSNVLQKVKRSDSKRHRLFSLRSAPSERIVEPTRIQTASFQGPPGPSRGVDGERARTFGTSKEDYSDVIDIRARQTDSAMTREMESIQTQSSSRRADCDSLSQSQPLFDTESRSDASGTLVTASSGTDRKKSASESDSRFDSLDFHSDVHDSVPLSLVYPMADPSPLEEEIVLAPPTLPPPPPPPPPPPAQPVRSTPASPAPMYIPRLTAPSMFLPIPNVRLISPLSHALVWWLAPRWSVGSSSVSFILPRFPSLHPTRSSSTFLPPVYSNFIPPRSR